MEYYTSSCILIIHIYVYNIICDFVYSIITCSLYVLMLLYVLHEQDCSATCLGLADSQRQFVKVLLSASCTPTLHRACAQRLICQHHVQRKINAQQTETSATLEPQAPPWLCHERSELLAGQSSSSSSWLQKLSVLCRQSKA